MTIKSIKIENFQSHKKTILNLSKGLNVIWGDGDKGKSSIIRAIRWLVENRPFGNDFRRHETKTTTVSIKKNKDIIHRRKSDTKNEYRINKEKPLKALKGEVPEEVYSKINISNENIQRQHEVYFLIDESPGKRSKKLNEIAGLQIMDKTIKIANSKIRSINSDIRLEQKTIEEAERTLKSLSWIDDADKKLKALENKEDKINNFENKFSYVSNLITQINILNKEKSKFFSSKFQNQLQIIISKRESIGVFEIKINSLKTIINKIEHQQKQLSEIKIIDTTNLKKMKDAIVFEEDKFFSIQSIIETYIHEKNAYIKINSLIEKTDKKIEQKLKKLGVCPLCKNKM